LADLLIGAPGASPNGASSGASYVVFGARSGFPPVLPISALDGDNGFQLHGASAFDQSGFAVSGVGDVNGDGVDDLFIGAMGAGDFGICYVVFGSRAGFPPVLALSALNGRNGFQLLGSQNDQRLGWAVSGAGDVNGDGLADLLIGVPNATFAGFGNGAGYVVFSPRSGFPPTLDLSTLDGADGFQLLDSRGVFNGILGEAVGGAGDVNGDGFDDVLIGDSSESSNGTSSGIGYMVFGAASGFPPSLDLRGLDGSNGFQLPGMSERNFVGSSMGGVGDVNGDGGDDFIIGGSHADADGKAFGAGYVIFGRPAPGIFADGFEFDARRWP